jgi:hypothetical protein
VPKSARKQSKRAMKRKKNAGFSPFREAKNPLVYD